MAEQTTIRADQIQGLPDLIREQVREVLREEARPDQQDMDHLRRSPAGTVIRLEEQVKALDEKVDQRFDSLRSEMNQRFEAVDQRFDSLRSEMDQRFQALESKMDQRFVAVDEKIGSLRSEMDHRFDAFEKRFSTLQWGMGLIFLIQLAILGKLFLKM